MNVYKDNKELVERDFVIIYKIEKNTFIKNRKMSKHFSKSIARIIKNIDSKHSIFLIGKDGKLKNSYPIDVKIEKISSDVDKMPMRIQEIQFLRKTR